MILITLASDFWHVPQFYPKKWTFHHKAWSVTVLWEHSISSSHQATSNQYRYNEGLSLLLGDCWYHVISSFYPYSIPAYIYIYINYIMYLFICMYSMISNLKNLFLASPSMEVSEVMVLPPVIIQLLLRNFPWNKPSSYWGIPMTGWKPVDEAKALAAVHWSSSPQVRSCDCAIPETPGLFPSMNFYHYFYTYTCVYIYIHVYIYMCIYIYTIIQIIIDLYEEQESSYHPIIPDQDDWKIFVESPQADFAVNPFQRRFK